VRCWPCCPPTLYQPRGQSCWAPPLTSAAAIGLVLVRALSGPLSGLSNTCQLVIKTRFPVVTFLFVFAIQNARDTLIRVTKLGDEQVPELVEEREVLCNEDTGVLSNWTEKTVGISETAKTGIISMGRRQ